MLRCVLAAAAACLLSAPAAAQYFQRAFPGDALRGELVVGQPPDVSLNGRPARLAPGARIRGADNMVLLSGSVAGNRLLVHYTLDPFGLVKDVWVLREDEAKKFWPRSADEAAKWRFSTSEQLWVRP